MLRLHGAWQLLSRVRSPEHALSRPAPVETGAWGFAKVPSLEELFRRAAAAEQQQQAAALQRQQQHAQQHEQAAHGASNGQQDLDSTLQTEAVTVEARCQDHEEAGGNVQQQAETSAAMQEATAEPVLHSEFLEALCSSSAFRSPHCEGALADAFHVQEHFNGLAGSVCLPFVPEAQAEHVRGAIKKHINAAWSSEAVRCGVGCAKGGNHDEAIRYYNRALELNAQNVDAFVARGAAKANQQLLREAAEDFQLALQLDPDSRNAGCYLEAVQKRLSEVAQDVGQERPPLSPHGQAEPREGEQGEQHPGGHPRRGGRPSAAEGQEDGVEGGDRRPAASVGSKECNGGNDPATNRVPPGSGTTSRSGSTDDDSGSSDDGVSLCDADIRRALAVLSKARSAEKLGRSKHKRHKSKSKKSKSKKVSSKKKKRRRSSP